MQATGDSAHTDKVETVAPRTARDWSVDSGAFVMATVLGALLLRIAMNDVANRMTAGRVATDVVLGGLCFVSLGHTFA